MPAGIEIERNYVCVVAERLRHRSCFTSLCRGLEHRNSFVILDENFIGAVAPISPQEKELFAIQNHGIRNELTRPFHLSVQRLRFSRERTRGPKRGRCSADLADRLRVRCLVVEPGCGATPSPTHLLAARDLPCRLAA